MIHPVSDSSSQDFLIQASPAPTPKQSKWESLDIEPSTGGGGSASVMKKGKSTTFPLPESSSNTASRLKTSREQRQQGINDHPQARWSLELIAQGDYAHSQTVLDAASKHEDQQGEAGSKQIKTWVGDVERMVSYMQELPAQSQKIVQEMIGNALNKRRNDTLESLDNMNRDMLCIQRFATGVQTFIIPVSAARSKKTGSDNYSHRDPLRIKQIIVADFLMNGHMNAVRKILEDMLSLEEVGPREQDWVDHCVELTTKIENAFTPEMEAFTQPLIMQIKAGQHEEAARLIASFASLHGQTGDEASWVEAASMLVDYCGKFRPEPLESKKREIVKNCLFGATGNIHGLLNSLRNNFTLSEDDEYWTLGIEGLLADMQTHPFLLDELKNVELARKMDAGEPLAQNALHQFLETADGWLENYAKCGQSLKAAVMPFVRNNEPVSMHEQHKAYIARHLARNDYQGAASALTEIAVSGDFDASSRDWINQCSEFIGSQKDTPQHLIREDEKLKALVNQGKPAEAEDYWKELVSRPTMQTKDDPEQVGWAVHAAKSIHFIAVPLLVDRIQNELENNNLDQVAHLTTELIQFMNDQTRLLSISPEIQGIIDQIKNTKDELQEVKDPEAVRPSVEPEENEHIEQGLFLHASDNSLVDAKNRVKLRDIQIDSKNRLIKSSTGAYIAHYASTKGSRLHADGAWLSSLPVLMSVERSELLIQALSEAMKSAEEPRSKLQNSYQENMAMLKRIKEQARLFRKEGGRFNPVRIAKAFSREMNFGELLDGGLSLLSIRVSPWSATPGGILNKYGKITKNALTVKATGVKEEYEATCMLLKGDRQYELEKLHPTNRKFCVDLLDEIEDDILRFGDEIKADDPRLQVIDAKLEWHQRVLSINHTHPVPVEVDRPLKEIALDAIPFSTPPTDETDSEASDSDTSDSEDDDTATKKTTDKSETVKRNLARDDVALCFTQFEKNYSSSPNIVPRKKILLFHGTGGTGKSYDSRRAGFQMFDKGTYTKEVPPIYYSTDGLVRLPQGDKPDSQRPQYFPPPRETKSPWLLPPEKSVGVLIDYVIQGYRIFLFEEGEKILLPEGRKSKEVDGMVKYLFDPDTEYIDLKIGKHEFRVPWDRQMFFVNSNKNLNKMGLPEPELRALLRRFDAKVEYIEASSNALKSAFDKNVRNTLALHNDQPKMDALKKYFEEKEIAEQIIRAGRDMGTSIATPDTVGRATAVITNSLLEDLEDVDAEKIGEHIDLKELCNNIKKHWKKIAFEYKPGEVDYSENFDGPPPPPPMPRHVQIPPPMPKHVQIPPPPQPMNQGTSRPAPPKVLPKPGSFFSSERQVRELRTICTDMLKKCNAGLDQEKLKQLSLLFLQNNCINEIIKRFTKTNIQKNVILKNSFIDRAVLQKATQTAHEYFLNNYQKEDFVGSNVLKEIHKVFKGARELMTNNSLQRNICITTLISMNAKLNDEEIAAEAIRFFDENNVRSQIMRYFTQHEFSTQTTLQNAVTAAHDAFISNRNSEDFKPKMVLDAVAAFYDKAIEENQKDVLVGTEENTHRFAAELSSSEMSDSDDPDYVKQRKQQKEPS